MIVFYSSLNHVVLQDSQLNDVCNVYLITFHFNILLINIVKKSISLVYALLICKRNELFFISTMTYNINILLIKNKPFLQPKLMRTRFINKE